jgi:hypothetical protein
MEVIQRSSMTGCIVVLFSLESGLGDGQQESARTEV